MCAARTHRAGYVRGIMHGDMSDMGLRDRDPVNGHIRDSVRDV